MPNIMPVSDLRNYTDVLKNVDAESPVFLTKNGRGKYVIMDIKEYEKRQAELKLLQLLNESENSIKSDDDYLTVDDIRKDLGV